MGKNPKWSQDHLKHVLLFEKYLKTGLLPQALKSGSPTSDQASGKTLAQIPDRLFDREPDRLSGLDTTLQKVLTHDLPKFLS